MSGFKPILQESGVKKWKVEFIEQYGVYRFDLYLMGLLWLKFLGTNISEIVDLDLSWKEFDLKIQELTGDLSKE